MRNKALRRKYLASLMLVLCFGTWGRCILRGEEIKQQDTVAMIDEFIMSDEFKAAERKKLHDLPVEAVELLTKRLNGLNADSTGELRVFECLTIKVVQFEPILSQEVKSSALAALKAKLADQQSPYHSHRLRLYDSVSPAPGSPSSQQKNVQPPLVQPPTPKKAPETKPTTSTPSEEPVSSTPWSVIVVLIVAATGLLWLLLKGRK